MLIRQMIPTIIQNSAEYGVSYLTQYFGVNTTKYCIEHIKKFADYEYYNPLYNGESAEYEELIFRTHYKDWFIEHEDSYKKLLDSITADYNPLENTDAYIIHETATKRDKVTTDSDGSTDNTLADVESINSSTSYESTAYKETDKNRLHYTDKNKSESNTTTTTEYSNTINKTILGETDNFNSYNIDAEHRHGNIGVTSNVTLLTEEMQYRLHNFLKLFVQSFIDEYCYLCEAV